jgi:hypothetical protein
MIIAPVGAYWNRVRTGIKMMISGHCKLKKTHVQVCLVVGSNWAKTDPNYLEEIVKPLQQEFDSGLWATEFPTFACETLDVNPENQDEDTIWLLEKLLSFFKSHERGEAFVDLTSAPREWVYSAFYVSSFFSKLQFYFVKSGQTKSPSQYSSDEKKDEGKVTEYVLSGALMPPLSCWLRPEEPSQEGKRGKAKDNCQYKILKIIYEIASEGKDLSLLQEVSVPIDDVIKRAKESIPRYKEKAPSDVEKAISRFLTDIDRFHIFRREVGCIVASRKAIVVMLQLFKAEP